MKASLILLFAFFAIALCGNSFRATRAYQQQCSVQHCEKSGEECGTVNLPTNSIKTGCIKADTEYCNITQTGNSITVGKCISYATLGQNCEVLQCGLGLRCNVGITSSTCVAVEAGTIDRYPGQPCGAASIKCVYSTGITSENTCVGGVCKYENDGASCNPGGTQCKEGSRCVRSGLVDYTCQSYFAEGSSCVANISSEAERQCKDDLTCMPLSTTSPAGICRNVYTQKEKAPCQMGEPQCKDGVCTPPDGAVDVVVFGVCKNYKKTSTLNQRCADDDDCTANNGESCVCVDDDKSVCKNVDFNRKYYKDYLKYEECQEDADAKCGILEDKDSINCYLKECNKEICKIYKNAKKESGAGAAAGLFGPEVACALVQACDASSLFASLPILAAIAAIVLLLQ